MIVDMSNKLAPVTFEQGIAKQTLLLKTTVWSFLLLLCQYLFLKHLSTKEEIEERGEKGK